MRIHYLILACAVAVTAAAQPAVRYQPKTKVWVLETQHTSYALGVNERNELQHLYWGKKLARDEDYPQARSAAGFAFESRDGLTSEEYPGWGGMRYAEPCLKVTLEDGVRDVVLKYVSHQVRGDGLEIRLKDVNYELFVELAWRVYPSSDVISKRATIRNQTKSPLALESAQSGVWYLPAGEGYRLSYLSGRWAGETQLVREPIHPGIKLLESRRGNTSHQLNPWFAIDAEGSAERSGIMPVGLWAIVGSYRPGLGGAARSA